MEPGKRSKIFLDSNVLLSGLFSDKGAPRIILDLLVLRLPFLSGATGSYNLMEVERNLKKKLPAAMPLFRKYLTSMELEIIPLPSHETVRIMAGIISEKDIPVLASAIACRAEYLITGDKKDFALLKTDKRYNIAIVSPSEFIETALPVILKDLK